MSGGLSGQMQQILAGGVGAARTGELRSTLLARLGRRSLETGGFNVPGLREVITQLGAAPAGKKREVLLKQAREAIESASDAVINRVGQDLVDLRMMATGGGGGGGGDRLRQAFLDKQVSLQGRLNVLEARGVDVAGQRARLAQAAQAAQEGELRAARQTQRFLSRDVSLRENALRVETLRAGTARTPEQVLAARGGQQRGAADSLTAREKALDRVASLTNRINVLTAKGVDNTGRLGRLAAIEAEIAQGRFATAQRLSTLLTRDLKTQETGLRIARLQQQQQARTADRLPQPIGPASPVLGGRQFPGSPNFIAQGLLPNPAEQRRQAAEQRRQLDAARRRRQDITSNALIGGAFPLLFGQGIGASVGGAVGGGAGGAIGGQFGFGLSLVGTAVGAQFDAIIQKAGLLGQALSNPIKNFDALQQGALLSSKGLERQVESLIAVGRESEAAALIQQDLAASYGGLEAAKRLADEQDRLNRSWSELSINLAQLALTPIADSAADAASALRGLNEAVSLLARIPTPSGGGGGLLGGAARVVGNTLNPASGILGGLGAAARFLFPSRAAAPTTTSETTAAEGRRSSLLSAQFKLITAQVQGYKDLALAAEKQVSLEREAEDIARLRARKAGQPEIEARQAQGTQERFEIAERTAQLQRDTAAKALKDEQDRTKAARETAAAYQLISAESALQLSAIREQISNAQALAAAPAGPVRDTLSLRQQATGAISEARRRELQLGAEIGAARLRGDEEGAARLVEQQKVAAEQTKLSLITGATALKDAATQLRDSAAETQRSLENLRGGNLEFLNPRDQVALLQNLRAQAAPEALRRGISLQRGDDTIESEVNRLNRFLNFTRSETQLVDQGKQLSSALELATRPITISNETLGVNLSALAASVDGLAGKDWTVQVNVNGTSGATVLGDVAGAL
jgi:hypothetical protein